jgi:hypothetical protein
LTDARFDGATFDDDVGDEERFDANVLPVRLPGARNPLGQPVTLTR